MRQNKGKSHRVGLVHRKFGRSTLCLRVTNYFRHKLFTNKLGTVTIYKCRTNKLKLTFNSLKTNAY